MDSAAAPPTDRASRSDSCLNECLKGCHLIHHNFHGKNDGLIGSARDRPSKVRWLERRGPGRMGHWRAWTKDGDTVQRIIRGIGFNKSSLA